MKVTRLLSTLVLAAAGWTMTAQAQVELRSVDSWDALKEVCQNPGRVNLQRPPSEITATCVLNRRFWQMGAEIDEVAFPGRDHVSFEGSSDKTTALRLQKIVDLPQEVLECPRAEEVEEIYTLSFSSTCNEVVNFEGDFGDFCYMKMQADTEALEDFKVSESVIPGSEMSLCNIERPEEEAPADDAEAEDDTENGEVDNGDEAENGDDAADDDNADDTEEGADEGTEESDEIEA